MACHRPIAVILTLAGISAVQAARALERPAKSPGELGEGLPARAELQ